MEGSGLKVSRSTAVMELTVLMRLTASAPPALAAPPVTGRLGVRFDSNEYASSGRLRIAEVLPLGPAAVTGIKVGDTIVSVDGQRLTPASNLDDRLQHTIGKRVALGINSGGPDREVVVRPVNLATEKGLLYRSWVEQTRAMVARLSNNRLGYAHMPDMSAQSLDQLFIDLDLSVENLPTGARLGVGSAVIEVTEPPHTGCGKFAERFGIDARKFVNSPEGKELRLRGLNAKVVQPGVIRAGDTVRKL